MFGVAQDVDTGDADSKDHAWVHAGFFGDACGLTGEFGKDLDYDGNISILTIEGEKRSLP